MSEKILTIISIQDEFLSIISKQLAEIAGDQVRIRPISVKHLAKETIAEGETVLVPSSFLLPLIRPFLPQGVACIVAKRGLNFVNMRELLASGKGKNILVVNDTKLHTDETVAALREIVFEHNYYAYDPGSPIPEQIDFVVTPGERQLVPEGPMKVIDIGYRILSFETICEILEALGLGYELFVMVNRYMKSLVALSNESTTFKIDSTFGKRAEHTDGKTAKYYFEDVIAHSQAMKDVLRIAKKLAKTHKPVHIFGETGTGKRMLAQAIHNDSPVKAGPYLNINCAARPVDVLERELFGIEQEGRISPGLFELANGGTLCIEEIDELPVSLQGRLLQALVEGQIIRTGGHTPVPVHVRIITTSNIDLSAQMDESKFRKDLFYYLAALTCEVPSLSKRMEDFEPLINTYLQSSLQRADLVIPSEVIQLLKRYPWPGNVRELFNAVSYMACLEEKVINADFLPFYIKGRLQNTTDLPLQQEMDEHEQNELIKRIEEHGFLEESLAILEVFVQGKKQHESYGRNMVRKLLKEKKVILSEQQLRLRLEVLNELALLNVRQGRSGTTISRKGEVFLQKLQLKNGVH
ncbi:sigma 54-interacting transcriptional regulator [Brevibacillus massiliensis]|uniref:sigma 54-interacting transcriptional regulator n=1 Tax=Brevibacillus massiliensis TaxID=1118054 RepID=UPI0002F0711E|nr:sigma 54-interacting transcriptional regulator [Brevibacillus massiliensis]